MKLFKFFLIIIFISSVLFSIYSLKDSASNQINPTSNKSESYLQLEHALKTAQISFSQTKIRDYQNQFEFYIINSEDNFTKVIMSTKKNPYWQITSLQEILKKAKINNQQLKLVDLSVNHPYATFKNN